MLHMDALWGVNVWFPPGLYTTTSVRVPVGGLSRRSGSVSPSDGGESTNSIQSPSLGTTPAAQGCAAQGLSGPVRAGGRRRGGRLAATARCRRRAGAASSSGAAAAAFAGAAAGRIAVLVPTTRTVSADRLRPAVPRHQAPRSSVLPCTSRNAPGARSKAAATRARSRSQDAVGRTHISTDLVSDATVTRSRGFSRAGAASSSDVSSPASVASVDMRAPLRRLSRSCRAAQVLSPMTGAAFPHLITRMCRLANKNLRKTRYLRGRGYKTIRYWRHS